MTVAKLAIVDIFDQSGASTSPSSFSSASVSVGNSDPITGSSDNLDIVPDSDSSGATDTWDTPDTPSERSEEEEEGRIPVSPLTYAHSETHSDTPSRHDSSVWAVNLVDVYTCPRTAQISHAFQVTVTYVDIIISMIYIDSR